MGNQKEVCRVLKGIVLATYGLFDNSMFLIKSNNLNLLQVIFMKLSELIHIRMS